MVSRDYINAKRLSDYILMTKKGSFLNLESSSPMGIQDESYVPKIDHWIILSGFQKPKEASEVKQILERAIRGWIHSSTGCACSAAFVLEKKNGALSVMYGSGKHGAETSFLSNLPDCKIASGSQWRSQRYKYTAVLTGTIRSSGIADGFAASNINDAYVALVIVPYMDEEVHALLQKNQETLGYIRNFKSFTRSYGNSGSRTEEISVSSVEKAVQLLEEETAFVLGNQDGGFVRVAVRYGANTIDDFRNLTAIIYASMHRIPDGQSYNEPLRIFHLDDECIGWRDCLAIPYKEIYINGEVERRYVLSVQDVESAVSFCIPPVTSQIGYYVKDYMINESSLRAFPINEPLQDVGVHIGQGCEDGRQMDIPLSSLHAHAFVSGATESGKTTTVKRILSEANRRGIPFVVIEAAKKEYSSLAGSIPELKIYTPGLDGISLQLNPLEPEDGVLIENQVAAVVRAVVAATGAEHPIPEAMDGLLKMTYQRFGWNYGDMAYRDEKKPFPTFGDVAELVDSYVEAHAAYGPEVKQNLKAALKLRVENMHTGALGKLFGKERGLTARELLESPCVIELSDFSSQSVSFLMNILLFKFHSYLSRLPECSELRRLIVVEEAHNVFKRTLSEETGRALNNEYFDKMLSEIRSSGTGLILSDQRPGIMSEDVMANTSVKIIHSMVDESDRKMIGNSCNLTEFQMKKLSEFKKGECVISLRGFPGVYHVMVVPSETNDVTNAACLICTRRFNCLKGNVAGVLERGDPSLISLCIAKVQSNPYNVDLVEENLDRLLQNLNIGAGNTTKICLLGEMLSRYGSASFEVNRIIVNTYAQHLRKGDSE